MKRRSVASWWFSALSIGALVVQSSLARAEGSGTSKDKGGSHAKIAATETDEDRRARAKRLYEQAAQAYAAKRNFEAIELFRQSAALEPSPMLHYNMALAYEEAGDVRNALRYFREYLLLAPDAEDAPEVRATVTRLERRLADFGVQQLRVTSEPSGATLLVDGSPAGVTPYTGEFTPGAHTLVVQSRKHMDAQARVELPVDRSLQIALKLQKRAEPPPTPAQPADAGVAAQESGLVRVKPLSWGLMGVGVGGLTAGVLFDRSRASSAADRDGASTPVEAAEARGAADSKQLASLTLLGAGGAFLITGGVLAILDVTGSGKRTGEKVQQAAVGCTRAFCGVEVGGRF
jgi:tetratricopeptide (TPR) repeat protein